jgi:hypothetical protein
MQAGHIENKKKDSKEFISCAISYDDEDEGAASFKDDIIIKQDIGFMNYPKKGGQPS